MATQTGIISKRNKNGISVEFDASELSRVLDQYEREIGRSVPSTLTYAVKIFCERMRALLPVAKAKTNWLQVSTDQGKTWVRTKNNYPTPGRGFARQSYREIARKASVRVGGSDYWRGGSVAFRSNVNKDLRGDNPWYELLSYVPYIVKLDDQGNFANKAIHNTVVKFMQMLERNARRALQ